MHIRLASLDDCSLLAAMNSQLIKDEGHRNPMDMQELSKRMERWLQGEYQAAIAAEGDNPVGYALFKNQPEFVYVRQLFVTPSGRRKGVARNLLTWLRTNCWHPDALVRVEVLIGNSGAKEFWRAVGFKEYCLTMEGAAANVG